MEKVRNWIKMNHMLNCGDKVVVGVSGGADSVCLLQLLYDMRQEYQLTLLVVHINHLLRGKDAMEDEQYTRSLCDRLNIQFICFQQDIAKMAREQGVSTEEAGREYRYACFEQVRETYGYDRIAVAHHQDDLAETVLWNLIRGSSVKGLAGIPAVRDYIIRPLLVVNRKAIEQYLREKKIQYCTDASNYEDIYSRNILRNHIVPQLCELNIQAVAHIAQTAASANAYKEYVCKQADQVYKRIVMHVENSSRVQLEKLRNEEDIIQQEIIWRILGECAGTKKDITAAHVQAVLELAKGQTGRHIDLPYGLQAKRSYQELIIEKAEKAEKAELHSQQIDIMLLEEGEYKLPQGTLTTRIIENTENYEKYINSYTKCFDYDTIKGNLHVRRPQPEDYIVVHPSGLQKRLNRYFIDSKIPAEQRSDQLLIADEHNVLWVLGARTGEANRITVNTSRIIVIEYIC